MKAVLIFISLCVVRVSLAQTATIDREPAYLGGDSALRAFCNANIRYPKYESRQKREGTVTVGFVVERDGTITGVHVRQSVCASLDSEALRLVRLMGRFEPGIKNGMATQMEMIMPVTIRRPGHEVITYENVLDSVVSEELGEPIYKAAERMPIPNGGDKGLIHWIEEHIVYPSKAALLNIEGKVIVGYIVNEDGTLSDFHIKKSLSKECDAEAMRVLRTVPAMTPASIAGKPVKVISWVPVTFDLGVQPLAEPPGASGAPVLGVHGIPNVH